MRNPHFKLKHTIMEKFNLLTVLILLFTFTFVSPNAEAKRKKTTSTMRTRKSSGMVDTYVTCRTCHGTGIIPHRVVDNDVPTIHEVACIDCLGKGYIRVKRAARRTRSRSNGRTYTVTCFKCHGTGYDPYRMVGDFDSDGRPITRHAYCDECFGKGYRYVSDPNDHRY